MGGVPEEAAAWGLGSWSQVTLASAGVLSKDRAGVSSPTCWRAAEWGLDMKGKFWTGNKKGKERRSSWGE